MMKACQYCTQEIYGGDVCGSCAEYYKQPLDPMEALAIEIGYTHKCFVRQELEIDRLLNEVALLRRSIADLRCELAEVRDTQ